MTTIFAKRRIVQLMAGHRVRTIGLSRRVTFAPVHSRLGLLRGERHGRLTLQASTVCKQGLATTAYRIDKSSTWKTLTRCLIGSAFGYMTYQLAWNRSTKCSKDINKPAGQYDESLPNYTYNDVIQHKSKETGMWVYYENGVYDITEFAEWHPGGPKILLAAGGSLEPFWDLYAVHKEPGILKMLEKMRIGNISDSELKANVSTCDKNDPFANDPKRHPTLQVNSAKPFNAEAPSELLVDSYITPNELFFVRNHLPVPKIDVKNHRVEISGVGIRKPISLSVDQLKKKFPVHTITAAVQCAGNRRSQLSKVKEVKGLSWNLSAISNAKWTGVKLCDVLRYAGIKEDDIAHVQFEGADKDVTGAAYGASIPAETALDPNRDVLLAFAMNDKELPLDHGYPVRVIVPGTAGARHVKWLHKIIASKEESPSHWQQNDYKTFNPSVDWSNANFSKSPAIQEYPVQSAICDPSPNSKVSSDEDVPVKGYAWSGGGRGITRVDVSVDGGKTWTSAQLHKEPQKYHQEWAWTLWEADIPVPKGHKGTLDIVCKAVDTAHNTQPSQAEGVWNLRGLLNNAWHHVIVKVQND